MQYLSSLANGPDSGAVGSYGFIWGPVSGAVGSYGLAFVRAPIPGPLVNQGRTVTTTGREAEGRSGQPASPREAARKVISCRDEIVLKR